MSSSSPTDDWNARGLERAGKPRRSVAAFARRALGAAGARARPPARSLAEMGALRSPPAIEFLGRRRGAHRRRRPSDAAVPGARRRHGDRGCGGGGALPRAHAGRCRSRIADLFRHPAQPRTRKVQRLATRNGERYHLDGMRGYAAQYRDAGDGRRALLRHYDWLYDWRPPAALSIN